MLSYFNNNKNNNKPLLCYTVKCFVYIRPNVVNWWDTTSKTGTFATGYTEGNITTFNFLLNYLFSNASNVDDITDSDK